MKNNSPLPLMKKYVFSPTAGKFFANLFSFVFGGILSLGALGGAVYYAATTYTIKQGIEFAESLTGSKIDYSQYVTEEYAQKTTVDALSGVYQIASKGGDKLTIADFDEVSPILRTQSGNLCDMLDEKSGIKLDHDKVMTTPVVSLGGYISDTALDTEIVQVLDACNVAYETNGVVDILFHTYDEEHNLTNRTFRSLIDSIKNGEILNELGDRPLCDILEVTPESNRSIIAIAYGNECAKDSDGNYIVDANGEYKNELGEYTGDYIIVNNTITPIIPDKHLTSVNDLVNDPSLISNLKIGALLDLKGSGSSSIMNTIADWTIGDLNNQKKINSLQLSNFFGEEEMDSNFILKHLKTSTIGTLASDVEKLAVVDLFEDQVYADADKTQIKGTWKYMLQNDTKAPEEYTIQDFNEMVDNMQNNIQAAVLYDLKTDGVMDLDQGMLDTEITYEKTVLGQQLFSIPPITDEEGNAKTTVGELTVTELLDYTSVMIQALDNF